MKQPAVVKRTIIHNGSAKEVKVIIYPFYQARRFGNDPDRWTEAEGGDIELFDEHGLLVDDNFFYERIKDSL